MTGCQIARHAPACPGFCLQPSTKAPKRKENVQIISLKGTLLSFISSTHWIVCRRKKAQGGAFVAPQGWHCRLPQGVGGGVWGGDTLRTYCTEDTPASISHAASISDLSTLSIPGEEPRKEHHASGQRPSLNDSGDNSSDNDNLLEQCIQSAMPKVRRRPWRYSSPPPCPPHTFLHSWYQWLLVCVSILSY